MDHPGIHAIVPNSNTSTAGIPLHCNICPKKPNFSDVSHLLTHIASKGHLSHYYKLKVKASTDASSKRVVDAYDEWYDEWRVEDLMMERMNQKEKKKSGASDNGNSGCNSRRGPGANSVVSSTSTPVVTELPARRSRAQRESTLDPQLGSRVKVEPKSRSDTPTSSYASDAAALNRSYVPLMQSGPVTPSANFLTDLERSFQGNLYSTPTSDSEALESPKQTENHRKPSSTTEGQSSFVGDHDAELEDAANGNTKLKGVLWNGMGMFDSATPDMRRKRNQKKAISVVAHLQATSEVVEATELVFDTEGDLRRERPITGNPDEDDGFSPLKGESSPEPEFPVPKKRATRRSRQALKEKDVNTGRTRRRRGNSHHPSFNNDRKTTPYFDGQDEDDELTYGKPRPGKLTSLSIHRDNTGPEITFEHPAPLSILNQGFPNPFQSAVTSNNVQPPQRAGMFGRGHQRQPSFPYGSGFRPPNNPLGLPPPNFGSFGQLNSQTMLQNQNPFAFHSGPHAFPTFQQQFIVGPAQFTNNTDGFQGQGPSQNHMPDHNTWDMFGSGPMDLGIQGGVDCGFPGTGDFASINPLFFSSNPPPAQDDDATVSPPGSEH